MNDNNSRSGRRVVTLALAVAMMVAGVMAGPAAAASGRASGRCDFNGDGYHDMAVAAPYDIIEAKENAGRVHVFYGGSGYLAGDRSQEWSQATSGVPGTPEVGDLFGLAVACGDFDGNGRDDLAVGAPGEEVVPSGHSHGAITILYGTTKGLTAQRARRLSQATEGVVGTAESGDQFGMTLAVGNFDRDGAKDLAVGVPADGGNNWGGVHVLYGKDGTGLVVTANEYWHQDAQDVADAREYYDRCGEAITAGDFNGDAHTDLAFSCPGERQAAAVPTQPDERGAVHVIYGSTTKMRGRNSNLLREPVVAMAAGFLGSDRFADLIMGRIGSVLVRPGASGDGGVADEPQEWSQATEGIAGTAGDGDHFGTALATGDVNGDAIEDLLVGAPAEPSVDGSSVGAVAVIFSRADGLTSSGDQLWTQDSRNIADDAEAGDSFGYAVATGDFNRDGRVDATVGVPQEDVTVNGKAKQHAGGFHMMRGNANGLTGYGSRFITQETPGVSGGATSGDHLGGAMTASDRPGYSSYYY